MAQKQKSGTSVSTTEGRSATPTKGLPLAPSNWRGDEKPGFKPVLVRGSMKVLNEHNDMEFRAFRETGESTQTVLRQVGDSKLYTTKGERRPKMVAHLSVSNSSPDPVASLYEKLDQVTEGIAPPCAPPLTGEFLMRSDETSVVLNKHDVKLEVRLLIDLTATPNVQQTLIKRMQEISACLATNSTTLAKLKN